MTNDPVNNPNHYTQNDTIECIDAIEAALTPTEFKGYLKGQILKYIWRSPHKNNEYQDYGKAQWYLNRLTKNKF